MGMLLLSLLTLVLAPVVYFVFARRSSGVVKLGSGIVLLDRLIFVAVAGLILIGILPTAVEYSGLWAIGVAVIGWWAPSVFEHHWKSLAEKVHFVPLIFVLVGLTVHGFLDGLGMVDVGGPGHQHPELFGVDRFHLLPWAIVMHQLPVAMFVWWLLYPQHGWKLPTVALSAIGVASIAGFVFHDAIITGDSGTHAMGLFQALVAGSLLHLVVHRH